MNSHIDGRLWGGRFCIENDSLMKIFNDSISIDKRLWRQDINGSKEWIKAIRSAELVSDNEMNKILQGLNQIYEEWNNNKFILKENDEDIHTANERRLKEIIGDCAMKLHTGRSRNDQVACDIRLWLNENVTEMETNLKNLILSLTKRADEQIEILMPGYTHMQRAQAIRWSQLLLSYATSLDRDFDRLTQFKERNNVCPLGSGAIAGNPFDINRELLAMNLNFKHASFNSIDSTANRDFIYEFLFINSSIGINLSKIAEDFIMYNTKEFSFIKLSDAYCTGSSLMPQKKNADSLELIRGKSGRLCGRLTGFLMTVKGIPTSYNKDLQEDKEALFDSFDTVNFVIRIATGVIDTLTLNESKLNDALSVDLLATDLAYYLVRKHVPFRIAHTLTGQCVQLAEKKKCNLNELTLDDLRQISSCFEEDVKNVYNFEKSVEQYTSTGGTSKSAVIEQIKRFKIKYF